MVTLFRTDSRGARRYYTLHDRQAILFSIHAFTAVSSTGDGPSRERLYAYESLEEMNSAFSTLVRRKLRGGYRVLYAYAKPGKRPAVFNVLGYETEAQRTDAPVSESGFLQVI